MASHGAQGWGLRFGASAAGGGHTHSSSAGTKTEVRRACVRPGASIGTKNDSRRSYCGVQHPSSEARKTDGRLEKWPAEGASSHEGYAVPQKGSFGGVP